MNPKRTFLPKRAFTLVELLVVVAIIAIILAMILPKRYSGDGLPADPARCMSNLKQIGFGLIIYAEDNKQMFPWETPANETSNDKTKELPMVTRYFLPLTYLIKQPDVFVCPTDRTRTRTATNFVQFSNTNLSYFVSVSATAFLRTNQSLLILSGDRHLSLNNLPAKPGLCIVETYSAPGWTREMHYSRDEGPRGNLLFTDGHVASFSSSGLPANFKNQPINPSHLAIP